MRNGDYRHLAHDLILPKFPRDYLQIRSDFLHGDGYAPTNDKTKLPRCSVDKRTFLHEYRESHIPWF